MVRWRIARKVSRAVISRSRRWRCSTEARAFAIYLRRQAKYGSGFELPWWQRSDRGRVQEVNDGE
jgi:hypothetical protein